MASLMSPANCDIRAVIRFLGGSMRACHAVGPGSIPVGTSFLDEVFSVFSSPVRQMSGSFRPPRSPNIIWPSLSSIIIHYGRQWPRMLTRPKTSNIHTSDFFTLRSNLQQRSTASILPRVCTWHWATVWSDDGAGNSLNSKVMYTTKAVVADRPWWIQNCRKVYGKQFCRIGSSQFRNCLVNSPTSDNCTNLVVGGRQLCFATHCQRISGTVRP